MCDLLTLLWPVGAKKNRNLAFIVYYCITGSTTLTELPKLGNIVKPKQCDSAREINIQH